MVGTFFKPYLKRQFLLLTTIVIVVFTVLIVWLRQPQNIPLIESRHQEVLCTLWRSNVAVQLASLRTKYITDRDAYLLQGYEQLENIIESQLPNCLHLIKGYQAKPFERTLEALAIQLIQKDDLALSTISELESMFVNP